MLIVDIRIALIKAEHSYESNLELFIPYLSSLLREEQFNPRGIIIWNGSHFARCSHWIIAWPNPALLVAERVGWVKYSHLSQEISNQFSRTHSSTWKIGPFHWISNVLWWLSNRNISLKIIAVSRNITDQMFAKTKSCSICYSSMSQKGLTSFADNCPNLEYLKL